MKRFLVAAVPGALDVVPLGAGPEVEVELLAIVVRPAVTDGDLVGGILGHRLNALGLDARRLTGELRIDLSRLARTEVRALGPVRAATPGALTLSEGHRRDGQRRYRNRYDSRPPHVVLSVVCEIHCTDSNPIRRFKRFRETATPVPRSRSRPMVGGVCT